MSRAHGRTFWFDGRRGEFVFELLESACIWKTLPAVEVGQVGIWYAGAPYSCGRLAATFQELAEPLGTAELVIA